MYCNSCMYVIQDGTKYTMHLTVLLLCSTVQCLRQGVGFYNPLPALLAPRWNCAIQQHLETNTLDHTPTIIIKTYMLINNSAFTPSNHEVAKLVAVLKCQHLIASHRTSLEMRLYPKSPCCYCRNFLKKDESWV